MRGNLNPHKHQTDDPVALTNACRLFEQWSDHAPSAFWILDPATRQIEFLSARAEDIWGRPRAELLGPHRRWLETLHPEDRAKLARVRSGRHRRVELDYRILRPDNTIRWIHDRAFPLLPSGCRIAGVATDVTCRVQAEAMRAAQHEAVARNGRLSALGQVTATTVHELSQPLTAVSTYTGSCLRLLALGQPQTADLQRLLEHAHREATRAAAIIHELRQSLHRGAPRRAAVDVNDLIRQTVELTRPSPPRSRVAFQVDLDTSLRPVGADPVQIQQVLLNLIQNAIDACEEAGGDSQRILIRTLRSSPNLSEVCVADTGCGFDPQNFDSLCEPLRTSKAEGWGLGLPICRSIIEAHGGRLWATRSADWAVCIHFALPVCSAEPSFG